MSSLHFSRPKFAVEGGLTPAERGTALHKFMQFTDFSAAVSQPEKELERMIDMGYLSPQEGASVNLQKIGAFFQSSLAGELFAADEMMREIRFAVEVPVSEYAPEITGEETILLQGVADCVYRKENKLHIVDYKTDKVQCPEELSKKYVSQMRIYKRAMQEIYGLAVEKCVIYSFALDRCIVIQC